MASLVRLRDLRPSIIYPGHGPVISEGTDKIVEYIEHRMAREKQVTLSHIHVYKGVVYVSQFNKLYHT